MDNGPTHLDLFTIAHSVRRAARDGDIDALHAHLEELRASLRDHIGGEPSGLSPNAGARGAVTSRGQQRPLSLLDSLLAATEDAPEECRCLVRAVEVEAALRRQARLEAAVPGRPRR